MVAKPTTTHIVSASIVFHAATGIAWNVWPREQSILSPELLQNNEDEEHASLHNEHRVRFEEHGMQGRISGKEHGAK